MQHVVWFAPEAFPGETLRTYEAFQKSNLETTVLLFLTMISFCLDFEGVSIRDVCTPPHEMQDVYFQAFHPPPHSTPTLQVTLSQTGDPYGTSRRWHLTIS